MKRTTPVTAEQVAAQFDRGVAGLDQLRARQMAEGVRLESAKAAVQAREHERLRRKYGDNHPRTQAVAQRLKDSGRYLAELVGEYDRASTPQPEAGAGWAVDGFVRTASGAAVPRVSVAATDRQGRWLQEFGYACTNDRGYFQLIVEKLPQQESRVYMRAFQRGHALASNQNRLAPAAGRADRIEIVIDPSGQGACVPPVAPAPAPPDEPPVKAPRPATPSPPANVTTAPASVEVESASPAAGKRADAGARSARGKKTTAKKRR